MVGLTRWGELLALLQGELSRLVLGPDDRWRARIGIPASSPEYLRLEIYSDCREFNRFISCKTWT